MVSPTQLSVLRMIPIARHVAGQGRDQLAVFRLLNSSRGWDTRRTPVHDAQWALAEVARELGSSLPVGLVGHSLGGRAAILAGGEPQVRGVVALAPWLYAADADGVTGDAPILVVHGTGDRIASPDRARAVVTRLARHRPAGFIGVRGARHAMLRRHRVFSSAAAEAMLATLLKDAADGVVGRALAGEVWQET